VVHRGGDVEAGCLPEAAGADGTGGDGGVAGLPILLLLDGLYANGPVMVRCRELNWDCMIVLQDGSLPSIRTILAPSLLIPWSRLPPAGRGWSQPQMALYQAKSQGRNRVVMVAGKDLGSS
jgi:hypothetical protein